MGTIKYAVELPYIKENFLTYFFPKEMVVQFDRYRTHTSMQAAQDLGRTEIVTDNHTKTLNYLFKHFDSTYVMTMDSNAVARMMADFPKVMLQPTNETEVIAGFRCKKTIGHFLVDSLPPITLLHTNEIRIDAPNWYNQFFGIDEVLLAYDVEQFGVRTRLKATSVEFHDVPDEKFSSALSGKRIEWHEMKTLIDGTMKLYRESTTPKTP
ncbi:MAG: hypothetical protein JNM00_14180 [Flavobacteriales bacterium]|nr:hypothetical protein [Flavobacteriales bacterium]